MLIIGKDKGKIKTLKRDLATKFKIEDIGPVNYFIGVRITRDRERKTISLCQDAYVAKILERFQIEDCHPVDTPMTARANEFMIPYDKQASKDDIKLYGSMIGSEMYLAVQTRPDITYAVSVLSRFLSNPSP